jgi:hypothetical protein
MQAVLPWYLLPLPEFHRGCYQVFYVEGLESVDRYLGRGGGTVNRNIIFPMCWWGTKVVFSQSRPIILYRFGYLSLELLNIAFKTSNPV